MKNFITTLFAILTLSLLAQEPYTWKNVPIGGGGYITGMSIHPLDTSKRYYRTDVGGAYRYDPASGKMVQMIQSDVNEYYSVVGLALHPFNTNTLYLSVGRDCNENSTILESTDAGLTFNPLNNLPILSLSGIGDGGCSSGTDKDRQGHPLAINPHNPNELYIGTRGDGLYIYNLDNSTITQVSSAQIPHNTTGKSVQNIVFHPTLDKVYIGYPGHGFYVGNTAVWPPTFSKEIWGGGALSDAVDISISKDADYLLVACKHSGVKKAENLGGTLDWSSMNVPPASTAGNDEGYLTVTCSPDDNSLALTVEGSFDNIYNLQMTQNSGSTWTTLSSVNFPANPGDNIFPMTNEIGSHVSEIAFVKGDPSTIHITDWFTTYQCNNFSTAGSLVWHNREALGHEEIVATDIVSFPTNIEGYNLMIGSGDHTPLLFDQDIIIPDSFPTFQLSDNVGVAGNETSSIDFCESAPNNLIACLTKSQGAQLGEILKSNDGGSSWTHTNYADNSRGIVASSSGSPTNHIVLNKNRLLYTTDGGSTYNESSGANSLSDPCNTNITFTCLGTTVLGPDKTNNDIFNSFRGLSADRNHDCVFYFVDWNTGDFSISTDKGDNWCIISTNLPVPFQSQIGDNTPFFTQERTRISSIPGFPGHLWINIKNELWKSTDYGVSWTAVSIPPPANKVRAHSFGKEVLGGSYPAIYIHTEEGNLNDKIFRSDDGGASWVQITDHTEGEEWGKVKMLAGDRNVPGRVHATVSGLGVLFGDSDLNNCPLVDDIVDGDFNGPIGPISNWTFQTLNTSAASGFLDGNGAAVIDIINPGVNDFDIQLRQDNIFLTAGNTYVLNLKIAAAQDRTIGIKLRNKLNSSIKYIDQQIPISTQSEDYTFVIQPSATDTDVRLVLLFGTDANDVFIDEVSIVDHCGEVVTSEIDCVEQLYLLDTDLVDNIIKADATVFSNSRIAPSQNVLFQANECIQLDIGFETKTNAIFEAKINPCN